MDGKTRKILARNVSILMKHHGHNQISLAKKAAVSQRTISNIVNPDNPHEPTLAKIDAVAQAYNLQTWHLLIPDAPLELLTNKCIEKVVGNFIHSSDAGRTMISRVSDREAEVAYEVRKIKAG